MTGVELFAIGATAFSLADVAVGVGAVLGAVSSIQQGRQAKAVADFNARQAEADSKALQEEAAINAAKRREDARRLLGIQKAGFAGGGVALEGTPLLVLGETAADAEEDVIAIRRTADARSKRLLGEAQFERQRGADAALAGTIGAGRSLLTGAGKILRKFERSDTERTALA